MSAPHLPYLETLRRVPDEIILSVATRNLVLGDGEQCLCGWFVREQVARMTNDRADCTSAYNYGAEIGEPFSPVGRSTKMFGGTVSEWASIWNGVTQNEFAPHIERAFVERVRECVR